MSSETRTKKNSSKPLNDGDHRKRRRNRTTQSCLNCHTSKRMCDRKRPACARCTQLGLTGLCVYEVDDPNQRQDSQDETGRLLKRVAELEGVIRELKNKPHPRWSQSANIQGDKWRSRSRHHELASQVIPSTTSTLRTSESSDSGDLSDVASRCSSATHSIDPYLCVPLHPPSPPDSHYYDDISSHSSPSPSLLTPAEDYPHQNVIISAGLETSSSYDIASMFLSHPTPTISDDYGIFRIDQADETCFIKQHGGHCGCLQEYTNYNAVLELSIRLRRAADILARSPSHHIGSTCSLNQRISDLDTFTSNTLGNMITSHEETPVTSQERACLTATAPMYTVTSRRSLSRPTTTSSLQSWDLLSAATLPSHISDDSLMSWEQSRGVS